MASAAATWNASNNKEDPTGPFKLSVGFLMIGLVLVLTLWKENYGTRGSENGSSTKDQIVSTWNKIMSDNKIKYVGAVQSLFEGSMYVFVLAWAPCVKTFAAEGEIVPFGKVFSCFMVSCMIGSSLFGEFMKYNPVERFMPKVLFVASASLALSSILQSSFFAVVLGFLLFEGTVGLYFPSINTLRSSYIPNTIRSTAMNIFRVPLNMIVVTLNLSVKAIGTSGALIASSGLLLMAAFAQMRLEKLYVALSLSFTHILSLSLSLSLFAVFNS
jgi:MFS transporter, MFS domain-containing protein family, molybdate-anion transporter